MRSWPRTFLLREERGVSGKCDCDDDDDDNDMTERSQNRGATVARVVS